jgi:hypothetical protein
MINKALDLPFDEPQETYSTSEHLFHDQGIPAGTKGRIVDPAPVEKKERAPRERRSGSGRSDSGRSDSGSGSRSGSGSGSGETSGDAPRRRNRNRRRTRGGQSVEAPKA